MRPPKLERPQKFKSPLYKPILVIKIILNNYYYYYFFFFSWLLHRFQLQQIFFFFFSLYTRVNSLNFLNVISPLLVIKIQYIYIYIYFFQPAATGLLHRIQFNQLYKIFAGCYYTDFNCRRFFFLSLNTRTPQLPQGLNIIRHF
jgi:hypothetical protein